MPSNTRLLSLFASAGVLALCTAVVPAYVELMSLDVSMHAAHAGSNGGPTNNGGPAYLGLSAPTQGAAGQGAAVQGTGTRGAAGVGAATVAPGNQVTGNQKCDPPSIGGVAAYTNAVQSYYTARSANNPGAATCAIDAAARSLVDIAVRPVTPAEVARLNQQLALSTDSTVDAAIAEQAAALQSAR